MTIIAPTPKPLFYHAMMEQYRQFNILLHYLEHLDNGIYARSWWA